MKRSRENKINSGKRYLQKELPGYLVPVVLLCVVFICLVFWLVLFADSKDIPEPIATPNGQSINTNGILEDTANTSEQTILHNKESPVIKGTGTITVMLGEPIMYLNGVTAYDDRERDITDKITVDSSGVDQCTAGIYTVIYRVVDYTGLYTEIEETVQIKTVDPVFIYERVDGILSYIIYDDMTQLDMVNAIFTWITGNVSFSSVRGGPLSVYDGAYRALINRSGNCFTFYSISEVMLTRAGIPNKLIERIADAPTAHRWNLVNPDDLGWHHYDSFYDRFDLGLQMAFFTDSQAKSLTTQIANLESHSIQDYYTYDPALYPDVVQ